MWTGEDLEGTDVNGELTMWQYPDQAIRALPPDGIVIVAALPRPGEELNRLSFPRSPAEG